MLVDRNRGSGVNLVGFSQVAPDGIDVAAVMLTAAGERGILTSPLLRRKMTEKPTRLSFCFSCWPPKEPNRFRLQGVALTYILPEIWKDTALWEREMVPSDEQWKGFCALCDELGFWSWSPIAGGTATITVGNRGDGDLVRLPENDVPWLFTAPPYDRAWPPTIVVRKLRRGPFPPTAI